MKFYRWASKHDVMWVYVEPVTLTPARFLIEGDVFCVLGSVETDSGVYAHVLTRFGLGFSRFWAEFEEI